MGRLFGWKGEGGDNSGLAAQGEMMKLSTIGLNENTLEKNVKNQIFVIWWKANETMQACEIKWKYFQMKASESNSL